MSGPTVKPYGIAHATPSDRPFTPNGLQPSVTVDRATGIAALKRFGYDDPRTDMVIDYCLWRLGHGEEAAADKTAIDRSFHGIDYTTWRAVLACAIAET
ncbi:MAG: hypothetical protein ACSLEW_07610 [Nocardioides sp.]